MRRVPAVVALLAGAAVGACFGCPPAEGPPLVTSRYLGAGALGESPTLAGSSIDAPMTVEVDAEADSVVITFESEGRQIEQRYRIVSVDDGIH